MAISTVASDQAKYKKMITDWLVSFALVFLLHYIIIVVLNVNNGLVEIFKGIMENMSDYEEAMVSYDHLASGLVAKSFDLIGGASVTWAATICYAILVGVTAAFLVSYIKRMLVVGFLIMIAPIITITYSIDRVGDGKAQALNSWLKEFLINVLIQPFHCLIYLVFANAVVTLIYTSGWGSIAAMILAILCMVFIRQAETIVKEIFGFKQGSTLADTVTSLAAIKTMGDIAKKAAGAAGKGGGVMSRNLNRVVQNNNTLNSIGQRVSNMPGIRQARDLSQKTKDLIDRGKNSDNVLAKAGANIAEKTGAAVKTLSNPALGAAIAMTAFSEGAENKTDTALNRGLETYSVASEFMASRAAGATVPGDIQASENNFRDSLEQFARQAQFQNYKNDPAQYDELKSNIERLLRENTDNMERNIQLLLNNFVNAKGYDLNNPDDVDSLGTDIERLTHQNLSEMPQDTPEQRAEYNLARAIQEKDLAIRVQTLSSTYSRYGITNPEDAIEEVLDRIQEDNFDEGPTS